MLSNLHRPNKIRLSATLALVSQLLWIAIETQATAALPQAPAGRGVEPANQPSVQPESVPPEAPTPEQEAKDQTNAEATAPANESVDSSRAIEKDPAEQADASQGVNVSGAAGPGRQFRTDRRPVDLTELIPFNFKEQKVEDFFSFIMECTGKSVIPRLSNLRTQTISVMSDEDVTRLKALELIFQAFRLNDIGIVETDELIMVDLLSNIGKLQPAMVLGPSVNVLQLEENGQAVIKIFDIKNTRAQSVYERLNQSITDGKNGKLDVDTNSNQIILEGDVGLAKTCQEIINVLDVGPFSDTRTETFRLRNADATLVGDAITAIFSGTGGTSGTSRARTGQTARPGQNTGGQQAAGAAGGPEGPTLIVTVLGATNSITVRSDERTLREIGEMIATSWDIPPTRNGAIFKAYDLKYTDPLKVRDLLQSLLESGAASRSQSSRGGAGARVAGGGGGGGGGESGADVAVANIFRIEAYPDSDRLIIITKTPDNFVWLDELLAKIDTPLTVGMPKNVQLKYQNAVEVAGLIKALLAESGTGAGIDAPAQGLSGIDFAAAGGGTTGAEPGVSSGGSTGDVGSGSGSTIEFPWQNARGNGNQEVAEVSAIIGKSRVVPNSGQNSLLVLATAEIQDAVIELIEELDKPGRQVLISGVLAEVELGDQFAMGIQFGPAGSISPANPNNAVVVGTTANPVTFTGAKDNIFPSVLNVSNFNFGVDATVILQALQRDTSVRILQQPRVFTSDNKEAVFFAGQDVPFLTGSTTGGTTGGGTTSSFDQIAVGIGLNVRPRITKEKNVSMEIEVLLSNVNTATTLNVGGSGNPTIDRRQTNTQITVKNNQTIVISGVRVESQTNSKNGFPILGDIPILDIFFSNSNDSKSVKELLVFITPSVVDNPDENDTNFNADERERLEVLAKPLNSETKSLVEKHQLAIPEASGGKAVDPLAPIDPAIAP